MTDTPEPGTPETPTGPDAADAAEAPPAPLLVLRDGLPEVVDTDEGPRRDTSLDALAGLRPVVKGGEVVTAGNSSSLNDGASAIVVAGADAVERYGLRPRARIVAHASAGLAPEIMGLGPVPATEKALAKAGLSASGAKTWTRRP